MISEEQIIANRTLGIKGPIETPEPPNPPPDPATQCRESAQKILHNIGKGHDQMSKDLWILSDMLPQKMTPGQDDALWRIFQKLPRP